MTNDKLFRNSMLDKLTNFRDTVPVYRIRDRSTEEINGNALSLMKRYGQTYLGSEPRHSLIRTTYHADIHFSKRGFGRIFYPSGAIHARQGLKIFEKPITHPVDKEIITNKIVKVSKDLKFDLLKTANEALDFERLWQIKGAGIKKTGERSTTRIFRAIGTFRRYINKLPVWGRASTFVNLADDDLIDSVGIDWRPCMKDPIDDLPILEPEGASKRMQKQLELTVGKNFIKYYKPTMFSLGYLSMNKRRPQTYMQPVYVGKFESDRLETAFNQIVVIPAMDVPFEPIHERPRQQLIFQEKRPITFKPPQ
ncbi:MAG: hypothetical protein MUO26_08460 [Methanotrichaceae archaeon]|nr:hypothetical protein [Methanotrichaceae archaeon]